MEWNTRNEYLTVGEKRIACWSRVRNELNGLRSLSSKAVKSIMQDGSPGVPYMPRTFPVGQWRITNVIAHPDKENDAYLYPFYLRTDAHQRVEEWAVNEDGSYKEPTGRFVEDYDYGLHFSISVTTLGCIRIVYLSELNWLAQAVQEALARGETVDFNVI